jgi:ABC-type glycerol-3-phosphate transport system substrate-binding protein
MKCTKQARPAILLALPLLALFLIGCAQAQPTSQALPPTLELATEGTPTVATAVELTGQEVVDRQLVIWAPARFQPALDPSNNPTLATIYEQFERSHPGVHIEIQVRVDSGEASLLSYLRSAQRVAPTILPDIILIDTQQLWQVADLELLAPLRQSQFDPNQELYPFTIEAATYNGQLLGLPYTTELTHLLYYPSQLADKPQTWEEFLAAGQPLFFIAGKSENLNKFSYLQYRSASSLASVVEPPDEDALLRFFAFLVDAKERGLIAEVAPDLTTSDAVWEVFTAAETGLAETSSRTALEHWDVINSGTVGYIPFFNRDGTPLTSARVWTFALINSDPEQHELSLALLKAFLDPAIHSQWSRIVMQIPAQRSAFGLWRNPAPYYDFLENELANARALPNGRRFADISHRLQNAQELVLRGKMTAEEATLYVQTTP